MKRDNCIVVDNDDNVVGSANKHDAHRFTTATPRGLLHRAFSVFLFDSTGRLVLQQRAKHKITFPGVCTVRGRHAPWVVLGVQPVPAPPC